MNEKSTKSTDWDAYYSRPYTTASLTRKITTGRLVSMIQRHAPQSPKTILEIGGGNSCFYDTLQKAFQPEQYSILDNNLTGLDAFRRRCDNTQNTQTLEEDIRSPVSVVQANLVFSIGLIEHFDEVGTRCAVLNHFRFAQPGGLVIIGFPTSTWLYRITRSLAELTGLWIFHDERPLSFNEVSTIAAESGELLDATLIWPIFLTQYMLVWRVPEKPLSS